METKFFDMVFFCVVGWPQPVEAQRSHTWQYGFYRFSQIFDEGERRKSMEGDEEVLLCFVAVCFVVLLRCCLPGTVPL